MHVEGVLLKAGDRGGEPFLFVFDSVGDHSLSYPARRGRRRLTATAAVVVAEEIWREY